ncbi:4-hydroxyphenylpyruvate dioxygenase-like protein [Microcaecilia unicolor]|uniref:4-hydroxyphenylpyruvate dioxygenase n=1 Tax=Microcaecilia unicolor TaxID=1415580 RepID=A0A6P7YJP5_9AMPH|nr:4-hydroxyphenylpyruvate dioxygenase-like protein [Microcaecilia unicolor]
MATPFLTLNHIAFHVTNGAALLQELVNKFQFHLFAMRVTETTRQFAVKKGSAVFLVNERPKLGVATAQQKARQEGRLGLIQECTDLSCIPFNHALPIVCPGLDLLYDVCTSCSVDTASNVSFEVEDVGSLYRRLYACGCQILIPPTEVKDDSGCVIYCVIKSIVGNIYHTFIDRSRYTGEFLPGFQVIDSPAMASGLAEITHFDHVTYACPQGSSSQVLKWYEKCFGFQRFQLHEEENAEDGYIISGDGVGLRLTAMQYWTCSKVALSLPLPRKQSDCRFVLAESLPGQGRNQVDTFLEQHGGAGIQHVALYTPDIIATVRTFCCTGVQFVTPPPAYYTETGKEEEIRAAGQDPQLLSQLGVLLDTDVSMKGEGRGCQGMVERRHLMQIFTKPIFSEETFFLELIQRQGASGFGEGNIRALWQAVQAFIDQKEREQSN